MFTGWGRGLRNQLICGPVLFNPDTISDYLCLCFNMPVLSQFDPRPAVKKWLSENGDRRCNRTGSGPQHFYFKGIFPEAGEATEENVGESV